MRYIFTLFFLATFLYGAMAFPGKRIYMQKDGTTFSGHAVGDEFLHYIQTQEGDILLYNPTTKNYEYAVVKNDRLVPSGIAYKPKKRQSKIQRSVPKISKKTLHELRHKRILQRRKHLLH